MWDHGYQEEHAITTTQAPTAPRTRFTRSRRDRVVRGVAGGLGARIGVDPVLLRIFLVVLTLAGGAGVLLYGIGIALSDEPDDGAEPTVRPFDLQQAAAVVLVVMGVMLFLRGLGLWFGDGLVWPALLAGLASAVFWTRGATQSEPGPTRLGDPLGLTGPRTLTIGRLAIGGTLVAASALVFLTTTDNPVQVVAPLFGITVGGALVLAPWLLRLWEQLGEERERRARTAARAEVAAHLHDSVLQTLALIQRAGDDARRMAGLARRQERELRAWLYGGRADPGDPTDASIATALDRLVSEVEADHPIDVDVVVVGEDRVDDDGRALLAAAREALVNVAKHAGVDQASLYLEVEPGRTTLFVRDRGVGFDPDEIGDDRHGLRRSVRERLQRHGGGARVTSAPGEGTEVELWIERNDRNGSSS